MELKRKPDWMKSRKLGAKQAVIIQKQLQADKLHTVCESAKCPNQGECFEKGTATFMILGETCTRNCTFCAVDKNIQKLLPPDLEEPQKIADFASNLKLKHIVITTVTRDDLPDGGASQFVEVVNRIRRRMPKSTTIELLISDLNGSDKNLRTIIAANPDVLNHNIETIARLYPTVRPKAEYKRSLDLLKKAKQLNNELLIKSGFMVGLEETTDEVLELMKDLQKNRVDLLTIGQYIAPSRNHYPVAEYIHPKVFQYYKNRAKEMGFLHVESAPLVRSSYHAEKVREFIKNRL